MHFQEREYAQAKLYLDEYSANAKHTPRSLWLGIRLERIFGNKDKEASYALSLKNLHPYSKEYLDYKNYIEEQER
jgi:type IV pilus assembly protein PilF